MLGDGIVVLDRVRRYGSGIAAVAEAIRRGDADATIAALEAGAEDVQWIAEDVAAPGDPAALDVVREGAVQAGRAVNEAARAGDARAALEAQGGSGSCAPTGGATTACRPGTPVSRAGSRRRCKASTRARAGTSAGQS